jgi:putative N6-adenine-specific DNA methylase
MVSTSRAKREQLLTRRPPAGADLYFATCPRGLEEPLIAELKAAGASETAATPGGVAFFGDRAACYRANLGSRIATRILRRVAYRTYRNEQHVFEAAYDVPWHQLFDPSKSLRVDLNAVRSPLKSLDFTTLRIKDAVCDRFRAERGLRPDVDTREPDVRVHAFLDVETASIYIDTSGDPLYKRGYRVHAAEAPLRENLAAGIIALTGWQPHEPLIDPMCGSGTLVIEAAMKGMNIAPGHARRFGFENLLDFDAALWRRVRDESRAAENRGTSPVIYGSDVLGREVEGARQNVRAAGLEAVVQLKQAQATDLRPPSALPGVIVANPPYGVRLGGGEELSALYPQLGDWMKKYFAGWRAYLFSADQALPRAIRLKPSRRTPLFNGALECRLYEYRLVAGSNRDKPKAAP